MQILYADESGNTGIDYENEQQPIFVLGGVIVEENKWHEINTKFNEEKQKILPILKYEEIHTNELFNSSKKSVFDQYEWTKNLQTLEKLVELVISMDLKFVYVAIDKMEMKKDLGKEIRIDPYVISFCALYVKMMNYLKKNNEKGIIFLDEIINIPEKLKAIYPTMEGDNKSIIEQAVFLKSKDTNFIQIADIFSFYTNKYIQIVKKNKRYSEIKNEHCIKMFEKLHEKMLFGGQFNLSDIIFK